jgi:hypothetical protein
MLLGLPSASPASYDSHMQRLLLVAISLSFSASSAHSEIWEEPIAHILAVGPEGSGSREAAQACEALTSQGSLSLIPSLEAMAGANPLARNWLRSVVETVVAEAADAPGSLPTENMKTFILDRTQDPLARHLAFDLYGELHPDDVATLVAGMIDDPSPPLRREAVAVQIKEGNRLFEAKENDASARVFRSALDAARDVDQIDEIAKTLRKGLGQKVDLQRQFGFLSHWQVIGPFDNTDRSGFATVFPPEETIDLSASYPGKENKMVSWIPYATSDDYGMVNLNTPYTPLKQVVGYAYTEYEAPGARRAELRLGCKNAWKIWLNGEYLFGRDEYHRGIRIDQYILPIELNEGRNTILVKVCQNEQEQDWTVEWEFQLRICDESGSALLASNRPPTPEAAPAPRRPAAPAN